MRKALLLLTVIVVVALITSCTSVGKGLSDEHRKEAEKDPDAKWFIEQGEIFTQKLEAWKAICLKCKDTMDRSLFSKMTDALDTVIDQWANLYGKWERVKTDSARGLGYEVGRTTVEADGNSTCQAMLLTARIIAIIAHAAPREQSKEDKESAKKIYRQLITTFTGQAYEGFVKTARLELEGLK